MNANQLIGPAIGIAGFVIVGLNVGWLAALGIFIMLWGNNIERSLKLNIKMRALYHLILKNAGKDTTRVEM